MKFWKKSCVWIPLIVSRWNNTFTEIVMWTIYAHSPQHRTDHFVCLLIPLRFGFLLKGKRKLLQFLIKVPNFMLEKFHLIPQNDFSFAISLFLYSRFIPLGRARHDDKLMSWSFWQWRRIFLEKKIKRCMVERKIFKSIIPLLHK